MSYRDWMVADLNDHTKHLEVEKATALGEVSIKVQAKNDKTVIVGTIDNGGKITVGEVIAVYNSNPQKPNIVVARSGAVWTGAAIEYARGQDMGWGAMGEISYAFDTNDYPSIQKKEYKFVEEGLLKHSNVLRLERLYDRVFRIHRKSGLTTFTITLINSYETSGEEVRHAIATYGNFDGILKTNPNGNPTGKAYGAAAEINADIYKWGELLGRLNKR